MKIADLNGKARWFQGPPFLNEPEESWPKRVVPGASNEELRPHAIGHVNLNDSSMQRCAAM